MKRSLLSIITKDNWFYFTNEEREQAYQEYLQSCYYETINEAEVDNYIANIETEELNRPEYYSVVPAPFLRSSDDGNDS